MTNFQLQSTLYGPERSKTDKSSYQGLCPILFLHFLPQLLEAGLQAVVERPQRLCDLLSMDANTLSEVRDLVGQNRSVRNLQLTCHGEMRGWQHVGSSFINEIRYCSAI